GPVPPPRPGRARDGVLPRLDAPHVDAERARDVHAELAGTARHVRGVGARDQGLGRDASRVDARTAEPPALDDRHPHPCRGEPPRQRRPRLARPDDDRVVTRRPRRTRQLHALRRARAVLTRMRAGSRTSSGRFLRRNLGPRTSIPEGATVLIAIILVARAAWASCAYHTARTSTRPSAVPSSAASMAG